MLTNVSVSQDLVPAMSTKQSKIRETTRPKYERRKAHLHEGMRCGQHHCNLLAASKHKMSLMCIRIYTVHEHKTDMQVKDGFLAMTLYRRDALRFALLSFFSGKSLFFLSTLGCLGGDLLTERIGVAFLRLTGLGDLLRLGLRDNRLLDLSGDLVPDLCFLTGDLVRDRRLRAGDRDWGLRRLSGDLDGDLRLLGGDLDGDLRFLAGDLDGDLRLLAGDLGGDRRFLTGDRCCLSAGTTTHEEHMLIRNRIYDTNVWLRSECS